MNMDYSNSMMAADPHLIDYIVTEVKSQGIFDQFRKECIADVDTKPAYQNLRTRVEGSVNSFLDKRTWRPDLNKNQLRETLRKHIHDAPYLDVGVERIVDQVVNPKIYSIFMPQIEDVVCKFLGLQRPQQEPAHHHQQMAESGFRDLLPQDLDPIVSPESDERHSGEGDYISANKVLINGDTNDYQPQQSYSAPMEVSGIQEEINVEELKNNLNNSLRSDAEKTEEEEESPLFEPIEVAFNESNISNDSRLSGISELTAHRTPEYTVDFQQEASSNSRLSIVTDPSPKQIEKPAHFEFNFQPQPKVGESTEKKDSKDSGKKSSSSNRDKDKERDNKKRSSHHDSKSSNSSNRSKDDRRKDDKKSDHDKETKDLKDLYKEKIRELREKKERESSSSKSKSSRKDHKSSSSSNRHSSSSRKDSKDRKRSEESSRSRHKSSTSSRSKDSKHSKDRYKKDEKQSKTSRDRAKTSQHHKSSTPQFSDSDTKHGFETVENNLKRQDQSQSEICLPLKKRPLPAESKYSEKELKDKIKQKLMTANQDDDDVSSVPDEERVQIIEVADEEYEEPYPDDKLQDGMVLDDIIHRREQIMLSEMEQSIHRSLHSMINPEMQQVQDNEDKESLIRDLENPRIRVAREQQEDSMLTQEIMNEIRTRRESDESKSNIRLSQNEEQSIEDLVAAMDSMEESNATCGAEYEDGYTSQSQEMKSHPDLEDKSYSPVIRENENYSPDDQEENKNDIDENNIDEEDREEKSRSYSPNGIEQSNSYPPREKEEVNETSKNFTEAFEQQENESASLKNQQVKEECSSEIPTKVEKEHQEEPVVIKMDIPPLRRIKDTDDESIGETVKLGSDTDNESVSSSVKSENNLVIDEECLVTIKNEAFRESDSEVIVIDPNVPEEMPQLMSPAEEECRFFTAPNDEYYRDFKEYFESVERQAEDHPAEDHPAEAEEDMASTSMAPPLKKFKSSSSPVACGFVVENIGFAEELDDFQEDAVIKSAMNKKRKMSGKSKKLSTSSVSSHSSVNGDTYDNMPSSPQSDISASSDKATGARDDKKSRNTQRYSSDDLYKPRPLFASSSRRNRRSNQS